MHQTQINYARVLVGLSVILLIVISGGCSTLTGSMNTQVFTSPMGERVFIVNLPDQATLRIPAISATYSG